ncbi:bifunctional diaminohydroxyphosphoribosylaminopyrimidine deaminase/5-amino-6-(5-phosphoribosylamino)uracil reductase RibD [Myxococcota bacterium]|nr:bifunctional diaminohydroxyphosphoribosylaminopyrimidine deaminase/5-amino-6-(5-phosphoribosylamino)uracil reductase RibD [Myxococcota bacterium]
MSPKEQKNQELMHEALSEAQKGLGRTRPNPVVGCIIVKDGEIVGRGYHKKAGEPHAEVVALKDAGADAKGADVYVTLEPCDHQGRTAPCTDALIEAGVRRVFVGMRDPNPLVNGKGIQRLQKADVEVQTDILGAECAALNEPYAHFIRTQRPLVVAKLAQSLDGRVATRTGESQWITSEKARERGHQLRNQLDAIMVGIDTVLADDPILTCRLEGCRHPVRIVVDSGARTPPDARILLQPEIDKPLTIVAVGHNAPQDRVESIQKTGATVLSCKEKEGRVDLNDLLDQLGQLELLSVLLEGGPTLMGAFFDAGLVSRVYAFIAPTVLGGKAARASVEGEGIDRLAEAFKIHDPQFEIIGPEVLVFGSFDRH